MRYILMSLFVMVIGTGCFGCEERVPAGYAAACLGSGPDGGFGEVHQGSIYCYGHNPPRKVYRVEIADSDHSVNMKVLCNDSLNFGFKINVLASVNDEVLPTVFRNVTADDEYVISNKAVFDRYARNLIDQEARSVVSRYNTSDIVANRTKIMGEIQSSVAKAFDKKSPIKIKRVTVNNLEFPDVITKAQELKAQRQVEIETERAEQLKRKLQIENEMALAEARYKKSLLEAKAIADSNKIIGESVTQGYLAWWQLKVFSEAAQGPNNWGFIPYQDHSSGVSDVGKSVVDAALKARVQEAMKENK